MAQDSGPTSHIYMSQRLRLHYVDWGNPDAPPLLLLHGGRDHCRNWDWIARELRHDWHIIAPDLRGHGDSAHSAEGYYGMEAMVYDLAQLIHQQSLAPLSIVAHSLGGNIALRYTGLFPDKVRKLVAIEGLGPPAAMEAEWASKPMHQRVIDWIGDKRALSGRQPKRYASIEEALARMMAENTHLTAERARHLTIHGISQNEDGSYSWKFDNYLRIFPPVDLTPEQKQALWGRITCDTLLVYGKQSWATNPADDGRLNWFNNARVSLYDNAGHWVHHDRHDAFVAEIRAFLA
ncbi:alpha/beta hydrolase [Sphingobium phenoxybenzoativorans]|uniref:Alpha/beta hydrolase n=1 Tax=Sphingobium phenoxybenzoativorans TaxID=1592790 RepID=A0A975Q206_9SPHN|nr:alpha/beta hydrolase [Sphingobium phenoxybenzoativorans]QUT06339.1 alpha/beta hydrolase [Sphingobium phenoxybenzoativorans]